MLRKMSGKMLISQQNLVPELLFKVADFYK